MIEYLQYFFNPSHFFSLRPAAMQNRAVIILAVTFGLFVIFGIISYFKKNQAKNGLWTQAWQRLFHLFLTLGILGLVYVFFAAQGVTLLAARFWLLIIFLITLVWLGFVAKYMFFDIPKKQKTLEKKQNFDKYIP